MRRRWPAFEASIAQAHKVEPPFLKDGQTVALAEAAPRKCRRRSVFWNRRGGDISEPSRFGL